MKKDDKVTKVTKDEKPDSSSLQSLSSLRSLALPAPMRSTESRFLRSTVAAYGSQLARVVIRIAGDLLLARLILPTRYGLFDLAFGIVLIAGIFRDLGLPYQLVRDERKPYGTVFLWTAGAGLALSLSFFNTRAEARKISPRRISKFT